MPHLVHGRVDVIGDLVQARSCSLINPALEQMLVT
jgi:hypothetical protein